jgi:hypothetical protein
MTKRVCTLAVLAAVGGALVSGCGSSRSTSPSTIGRTTAPAGTRTPDGSNPPAGTIGGSTTGISLASDPRVLTAIARCKASIRAVTTLPADARSKLERLCDQAASGDVSSLEKASAQVCQDIVKETVPSAAQARAFAACPRP